MDTQNPMGGDSFQPREKHHDKLVMVVFILVAVIVAVLLMFLAGWAEFNIPADGTKRPESTFEKEVDGLDIGDLEVEFKEIDASIDSL